jgi:hypothetical protein
MIAVLLAATSVAAPPPPDLSWMAGDWLSCGKGESVEEHWLGPSTDGMVGVALTRRGGVSDFEFSRIAREGDGWAFFASPGGREPVAFRLVKVEVAGAVFENPLHGFPKRLVYRREGDTLRASAQELNGEGPSWTYRRKAPGDRCD